MKQYSSNPGQTFSDQMKMFTSQKSPGQVAMNQEVTITRTRQTVSKSPLVWTARALRVNAISNPGMDMNEGGDNVSNTNIYEFIFPERTVIRATTDTITWVNKQGRTEKWKVVAVGSDSVGLNEVEIKAHCTRA